MPVLKTSSHKSIDFSCIVQYPTCLGDNNNNIITGHYKVERGLIRSDLLLTITINRSLLFPVSSFLILCRGGRRKISLPVYHQEDESNDLSDLGIGTSSASGKSSMSEDFDNQSVIVSSPLMSEVIAVEHLKAHLYKSPIYSILRLSSPAHYL